MLFVYYIKEMQVKSFYIHCWTLCTLSMKLPYQFLPDSVRVHAWKVHRFVKMNYSEGYLDMSSFLLFLITWVLLSSHLTSINNWRVLKSSALFVNWGSLSILLKLHSIAQFVWLAWLHPPSFTLYSHTLSRHLHLLSLITQSVISPWAIRIAQRNFIISMPIPVIFTNVVMTLLWMRNKGMMLVRKGQLGAVVVVQRCSMQDGQNAVQEIWGIFILLPS